MSLLSDLLDLADMTLAETKQLAEWSEKDILAECCLSRVSDFQSLQQQVQPLPVYDEKCKLLMNRVNAMPKGFESILQTLRNSVKAVRKQSKMISGRKRSERFRMERILNVAQIKFQTMWITDQCLVQFGPSRWPKHSV